MKKLIKSTVVLYLTLLSFNVSAIEYGQYICATELTDEDPDSFPLGIYEGYLHSPAFDGKPEQKFPYSQNSSDFTDLPLSAEDIADGMLSSKYNLFKLADKNISGEFVYNYSDELNRQIYFFEKKSDIEFDLNIISIYDGNEDQEKYICKKQEANLS